MLLFSSSWLHIVRTIGANVSEEPAACTFMVRTWISQENNLIQNTIRFFNTEK
jgi:hypothetical protein